MLATGRTRNSSLRRIVAARRPGGPERVSGLAGRLRVETRELHTQAERAGAMQALFRGRLDRPSYCLMLRNFHAIYTALESALRTHAGHPLLAPVGDARLRRAPAIQADLGHLHGKNWAVELALMPATRDYVDRLQGANAMRPARLLAHAYVRYLGDLSGGQILLGVVSRSMGLEDEAGSAFYRFDGVDVPALARRIRAGLDAVELSAASGDEVVEEARWAFSTHVRLFDELAAAAADPVAQSLQ
jgi:heme oxygenase